MPSSADAEASSHQLSGICLREDDRAMWSVTEAKVCPGSSDRRRDEARRDSELARRAARGRYPFVQIRAECLSPRLSSPMPSLGFARPISGFGFLHLRPGTSSAAACSAPPSSA